MHQKQQKLKNYPWPPFWDLDITILLKKLTEIGKQPKHNFLQWHKHQTLMLKLVKQLRLFKPQQIRNSRTCCSENKPPPSVYDIHPPPHQGKVHKPNEWRPYSPFEPKGTENTSQSSSIHSKFQEKSIGL